MRASSLALAAVVIASGCQLFVDLDSLEDRHCGPDEKACPQGCVPKNDPTLGCALLQCAPCAPPHAKAKCGLNGECAPDGCLPPWDDCNMDGRDGCETDLAHSADNCGYCRYKCRTPTNGIPGCSDGQCVIGGCNPGYEDCTDDEGCETEIWTDAQCLTCGLPCPEGKHCAKGVCI